jgi:hypothetical protein
MEITMRMRWQGMQYGLQLCSISPTAATARGCLSIPTAVAGMGQFRPVMEDSKPPLDMAGALGLQLGSQSDYKKLALTGAAHEL